MGHSLEESSKVQLYMVSLPSPKEQHTESSTQGNEHELLDTGLPVALPHTAEIIKGKCVYVLFLLLSK